MEEQQRHEGVYQHNVNTTYMTCLPLLKPGCYLDLLRL